MHSPSQPTRAHAIQARPDTAVILPAHLHDPKSGVVFPIGRTDFRIGRDKDNDLFLNETQVSRRHSVLARSADGFVLRDLGSTNGTYVNGRRITESVLADGDQIVIGATRLVFLVDQRPRTRTGSYALLQKDSRIDKPRVSVDPRQVRGEGIAFGEAGGAVLLRFLEAVTPQQSPQQLLGRALGEIAGIFVAERVVYVAFEATGEPTVAAVHRPGGPSGGEVQVSRSVLEYVRERREAICVEDAASDPRLGPGESIAQWQGHCIMGAPVVRGDQLAGILYLDRPVARGIYAEGDLKLLAALAGILAMCAENAGLYEQLLRAGEFSEAILRCLGSGVVVVDSGGIVQRMNAYSCGLFGMREEEVRGAALDQASWLAPLGKILVDVARDGIPRDRKEVVLQRAPGDDGRLYLGVTAHPLRGPHGDRIGAIANFRDLTGIRALEEEVRRAGRLAALGQMAAGIAHEVRNPLNSIRGFAELLQEQPGTNTEYLGIIVREVDRINRIVQDLLDFARIDRATADVFGLSDLVQDLLKQVTPEATGAKVKVVPPELEPLNARGSAERIRQVLLNLVRNAIEAMQENPPGRERELRLSVRAAARGVALRVSDTGPGIPDDVLSRIFDPFFTSKDRGTGLGLSICQKITEVHGGRLRVETALGKGTTFVLELPPIDAAEGADG
ncbi:MAG: FHA domain-containing protein [Planctomycetes bacterium]|nr:FHA domain-containing protein [Planctomycetota bacterium]